MDEDSKINNIFCKTTKNNNSYDIYSQLKSYDLNEYKQKKNFDRQKLLKQNRLTNTFDNGTNKNKEVNQINYIRSLIKKPGDMIYDGYLCVRKKPTINYLLKKVRAKENVKLLEENILFKHPYPLLKYLSNRKVPNKSMKLITGILSAELNDLTIEQKLEMKYKPRKSLIKQHKIEYPKIKHVSKSYDSKYFLKTEENFSISIISKPKNTNLAINTKYNVKDVNLNGYLNDSSFRNKNNKNKRTIPIILKKFKSCDNNIKLKEHATMTDNISFLRKSSNKKYKMKNIKNILKDISILKKNKHLMSILGK